MATNTTNFDLVKPAGSDSYDISSFHNGSMEKIDSALQGLGTGLAIISKGNTHGAISSGQYVYVHGHGSLAEGLYKANSNISSNGTLTSSNLTAVSNGGLNALSEQIETQTEQEITSEEFSGTIYAKKSANTVTLNFTAFKKTSNGAVGVVIPSGYRPTRLIRATLFSSNASKNCLLAVYKTGALDVTAEDNTSMYYGTLTYVI